MHVPSAVSSSRVLLLLIICVALSSWQAQEVYGKDPAASPSVLERLDQRQTRLSPRLTILDGLGRIESR